MAITNRTNDSSEQKTPLNFSFGDKALTQGETGVLAFVPFPCVLNAANMAAMSLNGTPNMILTASRFISGAGVTTWSIGSTFLIRSFGSSGVLTSGISLPVSTSVNLKLMANDVLGYLMGSGSTFAAYGVAGCMVVTPVQDVKTYLGGIA